jgi:uncharacterized protein YjiS (DUF1127 family)
MFTPRIFAGLFPRRRRRQATIDFYGLSDHQLRDLGLSQNDFRSVPSR